MKHISTLVSAIVFKRHTSYWVYNLVHVYVIYPSTTHHPHLLPQPPVETLANHQNSAMSNNHPARTATRKTWNAVSCHLLQRPASPFSRQHHLRHHDSRTSRHHQFQMSNTLSRQHIRRSHIAPAQAAKPPSYRSRLQHTIRRSPRTKALVQF
jgi:hypothetical protein